VSDLQLNIKTWNSLTADLARLPHALLFAGQPGIGKRAMAEALAARLLCESPREADQTACGTCASCKLLASGQHPDFRVLQPEAEGESDEEGGGTAAEKKKGSRQIRIAQLREIEDFFYVGGHRGGARACLIDPAEAMNPVTANSLLKILEEPSASLYFIMVSTNWRKLLPTLLSRVRRVMLPTVPRGEAERWLAGRNLAEQTRWLPFFGGAPREIAVAAASGRLKAFETLVADLLRPGDPLATAGRWETLVKSDNGLGLDEVVATLQKWLFDLALCASGAAPRYFQQAAIPLLAKPLALSSLVQAQQQISRLRLWSRHPLNPRLFLEDLCVRAFRPLNL